MSDLQVEPAMVEEILAKLEAEGLAAVFGDRAALEKRLIRAVASATATSIQAVFEEKPLRILQGLRLAAQLDFDLDMDTFEAMEAGAGLLERIGPDAVRQEFEGLLIAPAAGRGLRMAAAAGVMPRIAGAAWPPKKRQDNGDIEALAAEIHRCKPEPELRMALFLLCFEEKAALAIIKNLGYSGDTKRKLRAAVLLLTSFHFTENKYDIKRFILTYGIEIYDYLTRLAVQQQKVYDLPEFRTRSRHYVMEEIAEYKEAVFLEDLAITADNLMLNELVSSPEEAEEMRKMLLDIVHKYPRRNTTEQLLKEAKTLKNPLKAKTRNIRWTK